MSRDSGTHRRGDNADHISGQQLGFTRFVECGRMTLLGFTATRAYLERVK
jgi:hypothetical protein